MDAKVAVDAWERSIFPKCQDDRECQVQVELQDFFGQCYRRPEIDDWKDPEIERCFDPQRWDQGQRMDDEDWLRIVGLCHTNIYRWIEAVALVTNDVGIRTHHLEKSIEDDRIIVDRAIMDLQDNLQRVSEAQRSDGDRFVKRCLAVERGISQVSEQSQKSERALVDRLAAMEAKAVEQDLRWEARLRAEEQSRKAVEITMRAEVAELSKRSSETAEVNARQIVASLEAKVLEQHRRWEERLRAGEKRWATERDDLAETMAKRAGSDEARIRELEDAIQDVQAEAKSMKHGASMDRVRDKEEADRAQQSLHKAVSTVLEITLTTKLEEMSRSHEMHKRQEEDAQANMRSSIVELIEARSLELSNRLEALLEEVAGQAKQAVTATQEQEAALVSAMAKQAAKSKMIEQEVAKQASQFSGAVESVMNRVRTATERTGVDEKKILVIERKFSKMVRPRPARRSERSSG
jgi:hypothetical protein